MTQTVTASSSSRLTTIRERIGSGTHLSSLVQHFSTGRAGASLGFTGIVGSGHAFTLAALFERITGSLLVVPPASDDGRDLYEDLQQLLPENQLAWFPSRQILPYDFKAPMGEIIGRRISTLDRLLQPERVLVVAGMRAMFEPTIPRGQFETARIAIRKRETIDREQLIESLVRMGFKRAGVVEEVGDYAVRGGLIDFFSPGSVYPVRVELFDDEVESIRNFEVGTQRSRGEIPSVSLLPRRETEVTAELVELFIEQLPHSDAEYLRERYHNDPELPGLEWLSLLFDLPQGSFIDYLPQSLSLCHDGRESLAERSLALHEEAAAHRHRLIAHLSKLPDPSAYYRPVSELEGKFSSVSSAIYYPFRGGREDLLDFGMFDHPSIGSRFDRLSEVLHGFERDGVHVALCTDTTGQKERLGELIAERVGEGHRECIDVADLTGGFVYPTAQVALLTDHQIFGRYHRRVKRKRFQEGVAISDYSALTRGDIVVHREYGIARFLGLETIVVDSRHRDCLLLQYDGADRLYVPIEEFNRVTKYAGKENAPDLTRLGGAAWEKLKEKTRKAIAEMATELLTLYASRRAGNGFAFGEDSVWLRQLEASFIYEETPDQLKAIEQVKADMMLSRSMDRLICGDVGYGKTEVAIRAAFKAVENGKQVAILVPTTVLAQQHFLTFSNRFGEYPVRVAILSRLRTAQQQRELLAELAAGRIELVIGTHRLLSGDVRFNDLGLLVVDEEHRFGVKHKEQIRQLRRNVDTLAMSATPIPRTLQMALTGIRDMSLIATSPKDRLPIATEVIEFDPELIRSAILRERERGGQVFFVHNRVQTIEGMREYLEKLVPGLRIAVAHGQMHPRSLEGIMLAFLSRQFDLLLCTTIIESGLDIPSANTIVINRADRFGLAQLYQIRGRVGRSAERAFAYLVVPPVKQLRPDAVKRLHAIETHSHLGAGFALAMRDLEIRGAGEMLGSRQSGFIEEIGYDLYNQLLEETVARLKGETIEAAPETKVELDAELFLNETYIPEREQKVDIYRRLADATSHETVTRIRDEVLDRYGRLPQSAQNLFDATSLKVVAASLKVEKVKLFGGRAVVIFGEQARLTRPQVEALRKATDLPLDFSLNERTQITLDLRTLSPEAQLPHLLTLLSAAENLTAVANS